MRPIETPETDTTYGGVASKGIGNLPTQTLLETLPDRSITKVHRSVWEIAPEERAAIMLGSRLVMDVYGESIPPIRLAIEEPTLTDPATVYAIVDDVIGLSVGTSIASVLRDVGIDRPVADVAAWSDEEKGLVGLWLRSFEDGTVVERPAFLELSEEEEAGLAAARWSAIERAYSAGTIDDATYDRLLAEKEGRTDG